MSLNDWFYYHHRIAQCVEMLGKLSYAAMEEEDAQARAAYYYGCMDLILEAGISTSLTLLLSVGFISSRPTVVLALKIK